MIKLLRTNDNKEIVNNSYSTVTWKGTEIGSRASKVVNRGKIREGVSIIMQDNIHYPYKWLTTIVTEVTKNNKYEKHFKTKNSNYILKIIKRPKV